MKTITLNIPDDMRIGEAIWMVIWKKVGNLQATSDGNAFKMANGLHDIEDQDLLSLLEKL